MYVRENSRVKAKEMNRQIIESSRDKAQKVQEIGQRKFKR